MENFPIVTGGAPQRFPARLTAVAPHPGALTALGLRANGQGGDIHIDPQPALGEPMVRGLAITLQVIPRYPAELVDRLRCTGLQGARNRRLLGTARPPKGLLDGGVDTDRDITLGDGFGATEDPQQSIEQLIARAIAHRFLRDLDLFPQGGKETVPFEILPQGTQTGTARGHRDIFRHGELLPRKGNRSIVDPSIEYISLQESALQVFQPR